MRRLLLIVSAFVCLEAHAAEIRAVHKEQDRVIVRLDKRELAVIEAGQERLFVFAGPEGDFYRSATVTKVDVPKQVATLTFEEKEPRVAKGMKVAFAQSFWDSPFSPTLLSPSQYHQFEKLRFDAALGFFGDQTQIKRNEEKETFALEGTRYALFAYAPVINWFGLSLGLTSASGTWTFKKDGEEYLTVDGSEATLTPGAWLELEPSWRVSFHYEYNMLTETHEDDAGKRTFDFALVRPALGLVYIDARTEAGIVGFYRAKAKARDSVIHSATESTEFVEHEKYDGELMGYFRSAPSPTFLYHLAFGAVFYERDRGDGEIGIKTEIPEILRFRSTFEHRLDGGSKIDWGLTYDGALTRNFLGQQSFSNRGGVLFGYRYPMTRQLALGGMTQIQVGERLRKDDRDPDAEETLHYRSVAYQALLFAGYELDLSTSRRSR